ncbi:MAG: hypothetical protein AMS24_00255 [Chlamydiae bacterium SM23_39]|nr:MAG: hypothetical protein AMS24_00255 [Chlamydiae bacterium SM23_39]
MSISSDDKLNNCKLGTLYVSKDVLEDGLLPFLEAKDLMIFELVSKSAQELIKKANTWKAWKPVIEKNFSCNGKYSSKIDEKVEAKKLFIETSKVKKNLDYYITSWGLFRCFKFFEERGDFEGLSLLSENSLERIQDNRIFSQSRINFEDKIFSIIKKFLKINEISYKKTESKDELLIKKDIESLINNYFLKETFFLGIGISDMLKNIDFLVNIMRLHDKSNYISFLKKLNEVKHLIRKRNLCALLITVAIFILSIAITIFSIFWLINSIKRMHEISVSFPGSEKILLYAFQAALWGCLCNAFIGFFPVTAVSWHILAEITHEELWKKLHFDS